MKRFIFNKSGRDSEFSNLHMSATSGLSRAYSESSPRLVINTSDKEVGKAIKAGLFLCTKDQYWEDVYNDIPASGFYSEFEIEHYRTVSTEGPDSIDLHTVDNRSVINSKDTPVVHVGIPFSSTVLGHSYIDVEPIKVHGDSIRVESVNPSTSVIIEQLESGPANFITISGDRAAIQIDSSTKETPSVMAIRLSDNSFVIPEYRVHGIKFDGIKTRYPWIEVAESSKYSDFFLNYGAKSGDYGDQSIFTFKSDIPNLRVYAETETNTATMDVEPYIIVRPVGSVTVESVVGDIVKLSASPKDISIINSIIGEGRVNPDDSLDWIRPMLIVNGVRVKLLSQVNSTGSYRIPSGATEIMPGKKYTVSKVFSYIKKSDRFIPTSNTKAYHVCSFDNDMKRMFNATTIIEPVNANTNDAKVIIKGSNRVDVYYSNKHWKMGNSTYPYIGREIPMFIFDFYDVSFPVNGHNRNIFTPRAHSTFYAMFMGTAGTSLNSSDIVIDKMDSSWTRISEYVFEGNNGTVLEDVILSPVIGEDNTYRFSGGNGYIPVDGDPIKMSDGEYIVRVLENKDVISNKELSKVMYREARILLSNANRSSTNTIISDTFAVDESMSIRVRPMLMASKIEYGDFDTGDKILYDEVNKMTVSYFCVASSL